VPSTDAFQFTSIGIVHSCYQEKFGIPRQPGLVTMATAQLELLPPYNRLDTLDGIEAYSHIWVQFVFHACISEGWKAKVRPPRLGGKSKMGVFATRSTHRPNPIGLSVVKIGKIHQQDKRILIDLHGADLLDGTPILDIKPYLPYSDCLPQATSSFTPTTERSQPKPVVFTAKAQQQCDAFSANLEKDLYTLITQIIEQDPRPSYLANQIDREHGISLWDLNVRWQAKDQYFEIIEIEQVK